MCIRVRSLISGPGFVSLDEFDEWNVRYIVGTDGEIVVGNGDGLAGNPTIGLADVPDSGLGELVGIERDSKGRVTGTRDVTTDDLEEGTSNLYYDDSRVYETLKDKLVAGANVILTEDDLAETITISATGGGGSGTGTVDSVTGGTGIFVNNTDVSNPIVSLNTATQTILARAVTTTGSPTDGDILEYDGTASEWAVTKGPRELYLDGGNF